MNKQCGEIIESKTIYSGWLSLTETTAHIAGETVTRPLVLHPSGSAVLPYDPERRVAVAIAQPRLPVMHIGIQPFLEPVAGAAEDECPEETARRECLEEAGIKLRSMRLVGQVWMTPSTTTERVHLFLGDYRAGDRISKGGGADDEAEDICVREVKLSNLWSTIASNDVADAKLVILVQALRLDRPDLFA